MNFLDLANLLDNDGNMQNEMMVMAFAATLLSTIPVLLGNEFDINVGLKKKRKRREAVIQVFITEDSIIESPQLKIIINQNTLSYQSH